jgi:hypothetical protein
MGGAPFVKHLQLAQFWHDERRQQKAGCDVVRYAEQLTLV